MSWTFATRWLPATGCRLPTGQVTSFAGSAAPATVVISLVTLALFGASSGPVPPVDPQRLNAAGSVYLSRPSRPHFFRTHDEFAWRTGEFLHLIGDGAIEVTVSGRYPLKEVARAHRDLQSRKTIGSVVLIPWLTSPTAAWSLAAHIANRTTMTSATPRMAKVNTVMAAFTPPLG